MDEIILHDNDEDNFSYSDVLKRFQHPVASKRRDPRSVRLAAVTSAVLDIAGTDNSSAAQVYAKAIAALEGTLTTTTVVSLQDAGNAVSTQCAILELLAVTIPHVTPPAILSATLPLTSRIFRALVLTATTSAKQHPTTASVEEIGGTNALLRWICRVSVGVLLCIAPNTEAKAVKQFFLGTLIAMFRDKRPKVRKAAHTGVLELLARQSETNRPSTHSAIYFEVEEYIHRELMSAKEMKGDADFQDVLHLLPFVERSILYLNYRKLGVDLMEFITSLLHGSAASSDASDFLTAVKVKENSPKILLLGSLLSIVLFMIQDDDASRSAFLDEFAPRVLASLIQAKPMVVFASGSVEHEILGNTKSIYGQLVLASCSRIIDSKQDLIYKLLPLAIQLVLQLSCPGNGVDHGAAVTNVANTLFVELTQLFRTNFSFLLNMGNKETLATCLQNVLKCVSTVMDPSFRDTWNISLKALAVLLQQVFSTIDVQSCVNSFVDLRFNGPKSSQRVVESAVSALIQGIGIEAFWNLINWQSTPKTKGKCKHSDIL